MKRDLYKKLLDWKQDKYRKPLILRGARQVGKTYILSEFAKEYANYLYVNFEKMANIIPIFEGNIEPKQIIDKLQILFGIKINPGTILIIFLDLTIASRLTPLAMLIWTDVVKQIFTFIPS